MSLSRREFMEAAAAVGLAHAALGAEIDQTTGMPMRTLGKTGARVSVLAMGCGSRLLSYKEEDKALEALTKALNSGINYIDTAYGYGSGKSETWVGKLMPEWRKKVFLATKVNARGYDEAQRIVEGSLKRLQTDHVDLLHIHGLTNEDDLKAAEEGALKVVLRARDQKMARFIGITSHTDPQTLKLALERHDFDCTQMALNAARAGMRNGKGGMVINPELKTSFEDVALPVAVRKKMGIIAMKVFAQEGLVGKAPIEKLIAYALSLPVSVAVLGMPKLAFIDANVRVAKSFQPLRKSDMKSLGDKLSAEHKARLDRFFADHVDA
ncbi:MAG: aldo/keto reductase [Acidobacteria bacterium]|nr:aldo/keto reductase [Acidobacteriota bacterium]